MRTAVVPKASRRKLANEALKIRDGTIAFIKKYPTYEEGVKAWKERSGYHQRSKIEAFMHRYKRAFGFALASKNMDSMRNEVITKINILNLQRSLGGATFQISA